MSTLAKDTVRMISMLPAEDQRFAYEIIKRLVLAWDPDFSKVTPREAELLEAAEKSGYIDERDIDWDAIGTEGDAHEQH